MPIYTDPARRHDFVLLFDVVNGNPNGDPDAGNLPRVDPETMHGLVTDVALKRKVRDWVDAARGTEARYKIYVQHGQYLSETRERAFKERGTAKAPSAKDAETWMCEGFFDVRMFGAVLPSKGSDSGQVRGPVQLTFATSIDPITPMEVAIVGPAQNAQQAKRSKDGEEDEGEARGTMGRKALVPYGLYRAHGFFVPQFAARTGVTEDDLALFWQALQMMFELDRSASRGQLALRGLYVFTHDNPLGNAPAHQLFEAIEVTPVLAGASGDAPPPRAFTDYAGHIKVPATAPEGVTLTRLVG
jgi:CRISPR-associated protein Csd2